MNTNIWMVSDWHILPGCDQGTFADIKGSVTLTFHHEFLTVFVLFFFSNEVGGSSWVTCQLQWSNCSKSSLIRVCQSSIVHILVFKVSLFASRNKKRSDIGFSSQILDHFYQWAVPLGYASTAVVWLLKVFTAQDRFQTRVHLNLVRVRVWQLPTSLSTRRHEHLLFMLELKVR